MVLSDVKWTPIRHGLVDGGGVTGVMPMLTFTNDFCIVSIELVDGKPKVEWEPKTNRWTGAKIQAVLKGVATLEGPWAEVPAGGNPAYRFFKVVVVP